MQAVYKQTGHKDEQLDREDCLPVAVVFLYELYWSVRTKDGFSWVELEAYCRLWKIELTGVDLHLLQFINAIVTHEIDKKQKADMEKATSKNTPAKGGRRSR